MAAHTDRYQNAAARYFEAWNATGPEAVAKAVAAAWTADGGYTDPSRTSAATRRSRP